jgi:hypothetical protein
MFVFLVIVHAVRSLVLRTRSLSLCGLVGVDVLLC